MKPPKSKIVVKVEKDAMRSGSGVKLEQRDEEKYRRDMHAAVVDLTDGDDGPAEGDSEDEHLDGKRVGRPVRLHVPVHAPGSGYIKMEANEQVVQKEVVDKSGSSGTGR